MINTKTNRICFSLQSIKASLNTLCHFMKTISQKDNQRGRLSVQNYPKREIAKKEDS